MLIELSPFFILLKISDLSEIGITTLIPEKNFGCSFIPWFIYSEMSELAIYCVIFKVLKRFALPFIFQYSKVSNSTRYLKDTL